MSEATAPAAPAAAPAPAPAASNRPETPKEKLARAESAIEKGRAARAAPPAPAPATSDPVPAPAAPVAPAQNTDGDVHRLRQAAQDYDRRLRESEKGHETTKTELEKERAFRAKLKTDPHAALMEAGVDVQAYLKDLAEGKHKPKSPEQLAADENKTELQKLQEKIAGFEREKTEREAKEARQGKIAQLKGDLDASKEHFPLLSSYPWAAEQILAAAEKNGGDYNAAAQALEKGVLDDLRVAMLSDTALAFLLGDAEIKERVGKHFAPAAPAPDKPDQQASRSLLSPRTLTTEVTASAAASGRARPKMTDSDRRRAAATRAAQIFKRD